MKKLSKAICFTLLLGLICLCFSITACAQTETTVQEENIVEENSVTKITLTAKDGNLINGFTYHVDEENKTITIEGTGLLSKGNREFDWSMPDIYAEGDYTLVLSDGITGIAEDSVFGLIPYHGINKVWLGKDVQYIESAAKWNNWSSFEVSPENLYYASYHDCLYTKDFTKLIFYARNKAPNDFHPNLAGIGVSAFRGYFYSSGSDPVTIIIPWGVTGIGSSLFDRATAKINYVIPDTALYLGGIDEGDCSSLRPETSTFPYWIPSRNNLTAWEKWSKQLLYSSDKPDLVKWKETYLNGHTLEDIPYDNIASYYDLKPNSLKTFQNGKTYFFGPNYEYAKGWKQASGNWYYFNDYGAAVVKIWLKSGNKWYFMQADGTMATDKWIQWYNKWYYVGSDGAMYANRWVKSSGKWYYLGSDGAMYTNRYTPDGCWVNGSGVWVK